MTEEARNHLRSMSIADLHEQFVIAVQEWSALRALESVTIEWECTFCSLPKLVRWCNWIAMRGDRREGWLCGRCGEWQG